MSIPTTPAVVTDCVVVDQDKRVLLVKRKNPPFEGRLALPGGFVDVGETVEDACRREVREETSVEVRELTLIGVYSDPKRDPRGHVVSVAFLAPVGRVEAVAGDDAAAASWMANVQQLELGFDHRQIIEDALRCESFVRPVERR